MYQLTSDPDTVKCLITGAFIPRGGLRQWEEYQAWLAAGGVPLPAPTPHELYSPDHFQAIRAKAWEWMSSFIRERRYDSIETCVGYYNSGVPRYQAEAGAMVAWRDAVSLKLEHLVMARPAGIETWEQVKPLLPQPEAYDWPAPVELPLDGVPPVQLEP